MAPIAAAIAGAGVIALATASCRDGADDAEPSADRASALALTAAVRRDHGSLFARGDAAVVAQGDHLAATCEAGCAAQVELPREASGAATVLHARSRVGARFRLEGARPVEGVIDGDLVAYPGGIDGGDVLLRVGRHGAEDFVRFAARPEAEELRYTVWPVGAAALRQVGDVLEVLDGRGVPAVRIEAPWLIDATGRRLAASLEVEGCAVDRDPRAPWTRTPVALDAERCTVVVDWSDAGATYPVLVDPAWTEAGNMVEARTHHGATLVPDVGVLLSGGFDEDGVALASAEIGCPAEICGFPIYTATGSMAVARGAHGDAPLGDDEVLVVGGRSGRDGGAPLASAEVYDAATGTFAPAGSMARARDGHTATAFGPDGDVLVAGGDGVSPSTAQVFDASSRTFGAAIPMTTRRTFHAAEALDGDGQVLVVGGLGAGGFPLQTAEVFDATTGAFTLVDGQMTAPRAFATATRLDDGRVLVTGGTNGAGVYYSTADVFEPDAGGGSFQQQPVVMERPRAHHRATKLLGTPGVPGRVLLTGGYDGDEVLRASEVFDADAAQFELASTMIRARAFHTATRLPSGQVLVTGGGFDLTVTDLEAARSTEILLRDLGEPCAAGAECESGFCPGAPSGVCCDQACEETCETCITGTCIVVPDDTTVKPVCTDDVEILLVCADGEVNAGAIEPCSPFACDGDGCGTSCASDDDCSEDGWCNVTVCAKKSIAGASCTEDRECVGNSCADGVCCNAACDGLCEACDLEGSVGICRQNVGAPRPGRGTCEGAGGPCEGVCGSDPDACDYEPIACSPGTCEGATLTVGRCHVEERGACATRTESCGAFACSAEGDACATSCDDVDDCAPGHACRADGQCVLVEQAECSGDTVVSPDGTTRDCAPYRCREAACLDRCTSVDDCTAPSVCDDAGACVAPPEDPPPPDGCAVGEDDRGAPWTALVAALALLLGTRRRAGTGDRNRRPEPETGTGDGNRRPGPEIGSASSAKAVRS